MDWRLRDLKVGRSSLSCQVLSLPFFSLKRRAHHFTFSLAKRGCEERRTMAHLLCAFTLELLVFSVTPFKIDQNKNQNRSINKVHNLENERR